MGARISYPPAARRYIWSLIAPLQHQWGVAWQIVFLPSPLRSSLRSLSWILLWNFTCSLLITSNPQCSGRSAPSFWAIFISAGCIRIFRNYTILLKLYASSLGACNFGYPFYGVSHSMSLGYLPNFPCPAEIVSRTLICIRRLYAIGIAGRMFCFLPHDRMLLLPPKWTVLEMRSLELWCSSAMFIGLQYWWRHANPIPYRLWLLWVIRSLLPRRGP